MRSGLSGSEDGQVLPIYVACLHSDPGHLPHGTVPLEIQNHTFPDRLVMKIPALAPAQTLKIQ